MITPIVMGGTSESYPGDTRTEVPPNTMLWNVTKHLDPTFYNPARWVGYPAQYAQDLSYEESIAFGLNELNLAIYEEVVGKGNKVALLGYSQSAVIVRRLLANIAAGEGEVEAAGFFAAAGLVADPVRPEGMSLGWKAPGYGLAGKEPIWGRVPLLEVAAPDDPICSAPYNAFLRTAADFSGFFGFTPRALQTWMKNAGERVRSKQWQNANLDWGQFWLIGQKVQEALHHVSCYLPRTEYPNPIKGRPPIVINSGGGRHTCYSTERVPGSQYTHCELLAVELNKIARQQA